MEKLMGYNGGVCHEKGVIMSTTYSIVCDECKESCWVGQGNRIYKEKYIVDFLKKHMNHKLRFLCDLADNEDVEDYVIVEK